MTTIADLKSKMSPEMFREVQGLADKVRFGRDVAVDRIRVNGAGYQVGGLCAGRYFGACAKGERIYAVYVSDYIVKNVRTTATARQLKAALTAHAEK